MVDSFSQNSVLAIVTMVAFIHKRTILICLKGWNVKIIYYSTTSTYIQRVQQTFDSKESEK